MKLTILLISCFIFKVSGHARLMQPPSRASMWRLGFDNPANYNDNEGFCGGREHQINLGGLCGICGDAFDAVIKEHEAPGGKYANGIIVGEYAQGSVIDISIDVTSNHKGYFEFKLCPNNNVNQDPGQDCFDKIPLKAVSSDEDKYVLPDYQSRIFELQLQLPDDINCDQCILQWTYVTGNSWGTDPDGTSCVGCGLQENFRSCADIKIKPNSNNDDPTSSTQSTPTKTESTTEKTEKTTPEIPTTTTNSNESTTSKNGVSCSGVPPYNKIGGISEWCEENCSKGFCPVNMCFCG